MAGSSMLCRSSSLAWARASASAGPVAPASAIAIGGNLFGFLTLAAASAAFAAVLPRLRAVCARCQASALPLAFGLGRKPFGAA